MEIINSIMNWVMKKRIHDIELFLKYPIDVQNELFTQLINTAKKTEFGREFGFGDINSVNDYKQRVPIYTYEDFYPYIDKLLNGKQNVLWPSEIKWFAKSSGTTNAKSKFIPVSQEALTDCHVKGGKERICFPFILIIIQTLRCLPEKDWPLVVVSKSTNLTPIPIHIMAMSQL